MKRYVMVGLGVVFLGVASVVHAEMEVKVKDNTANNGFSIKEETTGSTIARFRGDGKVGIGTTEPVDSLEVSEVSTSEFNPSFDTGIVTRLTNPNGNVAGRGVGLRLTNTGNRTAVLGVVTNSTNTYGDVVIKTYNGGASYVDAVTVQNTGNVGIGTTDPIAKLEVQNSAKADLFIFSKQPPAVGNTAELLFSTTNAISLLSNAPRIYSYEEVSGAPWKMGLRFDTYASLPGPGRTTALAITGDGNVGIGTTNPAWPLHVEKSNNGQIVRFKNTATTNSHGLLIETASAASDDYTLDVRPNGVMGGFLVSNNGNVGIGYTSPSYKLDVNGTIRGSNVSPSDMRWKEHVKTLDNSLEKVNKLRGVSFEWKDKAKGVGTQVGLIAQEVEAVFPEVVSEDNEGYKSVAYDKLVGVLVESIKEQQRQIHELKASNVTLRQEIDSIKTFMSTYAQSVTVPASSQMR